MLDDHRAAGLRILAAPANDPQADKGHRTSAAISPAALDLYRVRRCHAPFAGYPGTVISPVSAGATQHSDNL
ncbi:hypothetical protein [Streptomyces tanashiensis]|uniref:hypothetical protein n=1 Tax=Streptomyces tanashiensis TaxID=67367 RepID=UPI00343EB21B